MQTFTGHGQRVNLTTGKMPLHRKKIVSRSYKATEVFGMTQAATFVRISFVNAHSMSVSSPMHCFRNAFSSHI